MLHSVLEKREARNWLLVDKSEKQGCILSPNLLILECGLREAGVEDSGTVLKLEEEILTQVVPKQ